MPASSPASPPPRPPLSCYIRTLNEARRIAEVVTAARAVADEVVIVDSGSTDATVALATQAGARVIHQPWLGNGGQKRAGEEACRHDWLLDLDADEVITPQLAQEITTLFADGEPPRPVYALKMITAPPVGPPWWRFRHIWRNKLYDRRVIRMPDHKAWDQLQIPAGLTVGRLHSGFLHYAWSDLGHFSDKLNRVSGVRARESRMKPMWVLAIRIVLAPPIYFLKHYAVRGLWRAGLYGFAVSGISAHARWLRDVKMYELRRMRSEGRSGG